MLTAMRASLTPQLPPGFYAEVEQHIWFREDETREGPRLARPDLYLLEGPKKAAMPRKPTETGIAISEPTARLTFPNLVREVGHHTIRIRDSLNRRVVTAIELLSPSNKEPGSERDRYLSKRSEFVANDTSLVEIDLLRRGHRLPVGTVPDGDYYIYVTDAAWYTEVSVWVFTVRDPIPAFAIPLPQPHASIALSIRPCLNRVYEEANYGPQIDYARPPSPRLRTTDAEWASDLLKKRVRKRR